MSKSLKKLTKEYYNLPEEEILEKFRAYKRDKCKKSLDFIIKSQLSWISFYAKKFCRRRRQANINDYINEGVLGVMRSLETFDESYGVKFSTYAKRSILNFMAKQYEVMGFPVHVAVNKIHKLGVAYRKKEELPDRLLMVASISEIPLDGFLLSKGSEGFKVEEVIEDPRQNVERAVFNKINRSRLSTELEKCMKKLNEKDMEVLKDYFGLKGRQKLGLRAIGDKMGVSHERVRQRLERGLTNMKKNLSIDILEMIEED